MTIKMKDADNSLQLIEKKCRLLMADENESVTKMTNSQTESMKKSNQSFQADHKSSAINEIDVQSCQISHIKNQYENEINYTVDTIEKQILTLNTTHEEGLSYLKTTYEKELADIKADHRKELDDLKMKYDKEKAETEELHRRDIEEIKHDSLLSLSEIKTRHKEELEDLKTYHRKQLDDLRMKYNQEKAKTEELHRRDIEEIKDKNTSHLLSLNEIKTTQKEELEYLKDYHRKQLDDLRMKYNQEKAGTEELHRRDIEEIKHNSLLSLSEIKTKHEKELKYVKTTYEEELKDLKAGHRKELQDLRMKYNQDKAETEELYIRFVEEIKYEDTLNILSKNEFHKSILKAMERNHNENVSKLQAKFKEELAQRDSDIEQLQTKYKELAQNGCDAGIKLQQLMKSHEQEMKNAMEETKAVVAKLIRTSNLENDALIDESETIVVDKSMECERKIKVVRWSEGEMLEGQPGDEIDALKKEHKKEYDELEKKYQTKVCGLSTEIQKLKNEKEIQEGTITKYKKLFRDALENMEKFKVSETTGTEH